MAAPASPGGARFVKVLSTQARLGDFPLVLVACPECEGSLWITGAADWQIPLHESATGAICCTSGSLVVPPPSSMSSPLGGRDRAVPYRCHECGAATWREVRTGLCRPHFLPPYRGELCPVSDNAATVVTLTLPSDACLVLPPDTPLVRDTERARYMLVFRQGSGPGGGVGRVLCPRCARALHIDEQGGVFPEHPRPDGSSCDASRLEYLPPQHARAALDSTRECHRCGDCGALTWVQFRTRRCYQHNTPTTIQACQRRAKSDPLVLIEN